MTTVCFQLLNATAVLPAHVIFPFGLCVAANLSLLIFLHLFSVIY